MAFRLTHEEKQHAAQKLGWVYENGTLMDLRGGSAGALYERIQRQAVKDPVAEKMWLQLMVFRITDGDTHIGNWFAQRVSD